MSTRHEPQLFMQSLVEGDCLPLSDLLYITRGPHVRLLVCSGVRACVRGRFSTFAAVLKLCAADLSP